MERNIAEYSSLHKAQIYFNTLNHGLNIAVAIFMTLYVIREGSDSFSWHVYLTTIGYQLLMTEAMMVFYSSNSWSHFHEHNTKKHIHWILQLMATVCIIVGNCVVTVVRTTPHFKTFHAITGKLISWFLTIFMILLIKNHFRLNFNDFSGLISPPRSLVILCVSIKIDHATNQHQVCALHSIIDMFYRRHDEFDFRLSIWRHARSSHSKKCWIYADWHRRYHISSFTYWRCKIDRQLY